MPKDRVLSTKTFVISHLTILIVALAFFGGLYYILYEDRFNGTAFTYNPVTKEPVSLFLEVTAPEDDILTSDNSIVISGRTSPEATVVITSQTSDTGLEAGKDGQFSKVFPLALGANIIEITSFDKDGNTKTTVKSVFYSEEKI